MSRAFLMTAERLAFITVFVISRMMASKRLARTDIRNGSMRGRASAVASAACSWLGATAEFTRWFIGDPSSLGGEPSPSVPARDLLFDQILSWTCLPLQAGRHRLG